MVGQHPGGGRADRRGVDSARRSPRAARSRPTAREVGEVERRVQFVGAQVAGEPLVVGTHASATNTFPSGYESATSPPATVDLVHAVVVPERVVGAVAGSSISSSAASGARRRAAPRPSPGRARRRCGTRRRPGRTRSAAPTRTRRRPPGSSSPGRAGRGRRGAGTRTVGDPGPGRTAEDALPVVGRPVAAAGPEQVPRPGGRRRRANAAWNQACWSEVWLGTMSSSTRRPSACASAISAAASAEVPKAGSIAAVVRHVVARVGHRRRVPRVDPHRVDAEVAQVSEASPDPGDVADPVPVRRRRSCGCRAGRPPRSATIRWWRAPPPSSRGTSRSFRVEID